MAVESEGAGHVVSTVKKQNDDPLCSTHFLSCIQDKISEPGMGIMSPTPTVGRSSNKFNPSPFNFTSLIFFRYRKSTTKFFPEHHTDDL